MAKISTYPIANPVSPDDMVIGTSNLSEFPLQTKNFKVSDINALGSTPIPVATFALSDNDYTISPECGIFNYTDFNLPSPKLKFNKTILADETGDIQRVGTKIKLNSGGIYSFELSYNINLYFQGSKWVGDEHLIRLPVSCPDFIQGSLACFDNPIKIYSSASTGDQLDTNQYVSWTLGFYPGQEVELGMLFFIEFENPGLCEDWYVKFQDRNVSEDGLSYIRGLEVTVKRFRQFTTEEYLKYAEAVGLTSSAAVP